MPKRPPRDSGEPPLAGSDDEHVKERDVIGTRQLLARRAQAEFRTDAPRRREQRADEHGAVEPDRLKHVGESIHRLSPRVAAEALSSVEQPIASGAAKASAGRAPPPKAD